MLNLRKVAITGGLACGKSSVCRFFEDLGAYVISADKIVHQLLSPETNLGQEVVRLLGEDIIAEGQVDRAKIAKKVFNHPNLLYSLESLLHPAVRAEVITQYNRVKKESKYTLFIAEIPLLFEGGGGKVDYEAIIAVIADPEVCKARFIASGYNEEEFNKRASRQFSPSEKSLLSDYTIVNNGSLSELRESVREVYEKIIK